MNTQKTYTWSARSKSDRENQIAGIITMRSGNLRYSYEYNWLQLPPELKGCRCSSVACGSDGLVYGYFHNKNSPVAVFDSHGRFQRYYPEQLESEHPHGMFVAKDNSIWLADSGLQIVRHLDTNGNTIMTLGTYRKGSDTGVDSSLTNPYLAYLTVKQMGKPFNRPTGVFQADNGNVYVSDGYCNCAFHIFDKTGILLRSVGAPGRGAGQFNIPYNIWMDKENRIWVADHINDRVQIFRENGDYLSEIDGLLCPTDIWSDKQRVFISELDGRISVFDMSCNLIAQLGFCGSAYKICSITGDQNGCLYLGLLSDYPIVKLSPY